MYLFINVILFLEVLYSIVYYINKTSIFCTIATVGGWGHVAKLRTAKYHLLGLGSISVQLQTIIYNIYNNRIEI